MVPSGGHVQAQCRLIREEASHRKGASEMKESTTALKMITILVALVVLVAAAGIGPVKAGPTEADATSI